jgi:murein DD-endopeptidase MepM/ murein hydrolase activator NlpD
MRKLPIALIALLLSLALPGCGAAAPAATNTENPVAVSPSPDLPQVHTVPATPITTTPSVAPTTTPPNDPISTAVPPFVLCSPLSEHTLAELPEIVSAPYNPPPMGSDARHQGVDFSYYRRGDRSSILGMGVQSIFAGRVAASIAGSFPYGNVVIIEIPASDLPPELVEQLGIIGGESLYALYAHMGAAPIVSLGDSVTACQPLGEVGKSGNAGVPHLHLEMRIGPANQQFASMAFYSTQTTQEERDNYTLWRMSGEFRHFDPMIVLAP